MKQCFTLAIFSFVVLSLKAQSDSTKPELKISINYNSNLNYYGRTDSLKSSSVFPLVEFWATPNFYINAASVFVNNALSTFDYAGTVATIGYQFNKNESWLSNVYLLKPFYTRDAQLVQSALKLQSGASATYLNKIINLTAGADVKFSDNIDLGATAGLDHIVRIQNKDNSVLIIDPSVYAYAGTQRFTTTYYKNRPGLLNPGRREEVTENDSKFSILAYEASLPIIYAKNKWMVLATPSYVIPRNLINDPNRPELTEQGENTFYATLGLKYTF